MCWITNKKLKFKIAKENIPIYKICRKENDKILSYFKRFEYKLDCLYNTNFEVSFTPDSSIIYKGFHSYSLNKTYLDKRYDNIRVFKNESFIELIFNSNSNKLNDYSFGIVVSGYIPEDGAYALNEYGEYVSDSIVLNKIENA